MKKKYIFVGPAGDSQANRESNQRSDLEIFDRIFNKFVNGQISFDQCLKEIEKYYNNVFLQKWEKIDKREEEVNLDLDSQTRRRIENCSSQIQ